MKKIIDEQHLTSYGWNIYWEEAMKALPHNKISLVPARVVAQYSKQYRLITHDGEVTAEVTGKFEFNTVDRSDFPAVGDWVAVEPLQGESRTVIHAVLPRRTAMVRKEAGSRVEGQVIGANMDIVFIVSALNQDFNLRRIERFLVAVWESGAQPVIVLTKSDLCSKPVEYINSVESIAPGVPICVVSAIQNVGKEEIVSHLLSGSTIAITGSSGAGKSTLVNWFAGYDMQSVQGIRENDAKGRHTTTHRELFLLPNGSIMMDTPGMRELQLWESEAGWQTTFSDIEALVTSCRFRDCQHQSESDCAVKSALDEGSLDPRRYANYLKTRKELVYLERKESVHQRTKKIHTKKSTKEVRQRYDKSIYDNE